MPVVELVFPLFKTEPQSVLQLRQTWPIMFNSVSDAKGLDAAFSKNIVRLNGKDISPNEMKSVMIFHWADAASFHSFYPDSDAFKSFIEKVKPFAAGPAKPELYEDTHEAIPSTKAKVTQIIKGPDDTQTQDLWKTFCEAVSESTDVLPRTALCRGIEERKGTFVSLIGWKNQEQYEHVLELPRVAEIIKAIDSHAEVQNIVTEAC